MWFWLEKRKLHRRQDANAKAKAKVARKAAVKARG